MAKSDLGLYDSSSQAAGNQAITPTSRSPVKDREPKCVSLCHDVVFSDMSDPLHPPHSHLTSMTTPPPLR